MRISEDSFSPYEAKAETEPKQVISPEIDAIFDCVKAIKLAGEENLLEAQVAAAVELAARIKAYTKSLMGSESVKAAVEQIALDGLTIDWAMHQVECGNYGFDVSDAEPLPSSEEIEAQETPTLEDAVEARFGEVKEELRRFTGKDISTLDSPDSPIKPKVAIAAVITTGSSPTERLNAYRTVLIERENLIERAASLQLNQAA